MLYSFTNHFCEIASGRNFYSCAKELCNLAKFIMKVPVILADEVVLLFS